MAAKRFSADVDRWVRKSRARMAAVFKESTDRVIAEAQVPVAEGGRMRVDTGFLRASGQASLNGLPSGPSRPAEGVFRYTHRREDVALVISRAQLGDTVFFGWTANYARHREVRDGFLRSAAQNWRPIVASVTAEAKRRFP
jgi:hypothetical protein